MRGEIILAVSKASCQYMLCGSRLFIDTAIVSAFMQGTHCSNIKCQAAVYILQSDHYRV